MALPNNVPIVAFEPQRQNLDCLFQNLASNEWTDHAEVFPVALSSHPGLLTLYGASGPSASLLKNWAGYSPKHKQIVPISTLDIVIGTRFPGKQLLIKIDVEGAEYQVLEGALSNISKDPKPFWLIEITLSELHPNGINPNFERIFELFWKHKYSAFVASVPPQPVGRGDVSSWVKQHKTATGRFNYVFIDEALDPDAYWNSNQ